MPLIQKNKSETRPFRAVLGLLMATLSFLIDKLGLLVGIFGLPLGDIRPVGGIIGLLLGKN